MDANGGKHNGTITVTVDPSLFRGRIIGTRDNVLQILDTVGSVSNGNIDLCFCCFNGAVEIDNYGGRGNSLISS